MKQYCKFESALDILIGKTTIYNETEAVPKVGSLT